MQRLQRLECKAGMSMHCHSRVYVLLQAYIGHKSSHNTTDTNDMNAASDVCLHALVVVAITVQNSANCMCVENPGEHRNVAACQVPQKHLDIAAVCNV